MTSTIALQFDKLILKLVHGVHHQRLKLNQSYIWGMIDNVLGCSLMCSYRISITDLAKFKRDFALLICFLHDQYLKSEIWYILHTSYCIFIF